MKVKGNVMSFRAYFQEAILTKKLPSINNIFKSNYFCTWEYCVKKNPAGIYDFVVLCV